MESLPDMAWTNGRAFKDDLGEIARHPVGRDADPPR
jgi:hypothetical protein